MNKLKIHVLPNHIINQIAAGEVVERPASVLKELLENSIDAGATEIKVVVEDGGTKSIKVIDNGSGMQPEDAKAAFLPHSTSKIKEVEDLEKILTLGFRGEALASISSVAKVELVTKVTKALSGFRMIMDAGEILEEEEIGTPDGTSFYIKDLFHNIPARKKFLKTVPTELRHIVKTFSNIAIANPEISFELSHNGKTLFILPKTRNLKERIRNLIGESFANNSFPISYDGLIKVTGYVGLPKIAMNRKNTQIILVNGRAITNSTIIAAVKDAFATAMPKKSYPQFVLDLQVDPTKVDVNVHPRKLEVRFAEQQTIYRSVRDTVKSNLEKALQEDTTGKLSGFTPPLNKVGTNGKYRQSSTKTYEQRPSGSAIKESLSFTKSLLKNTPQNPLPWEDSPTVKGRSPSVTERMEEEMQGNITNLQFPVFQLLNAYLITTNGAAIQIIDQHAAAERVTYEKILKSIEKGNLETQALLIPFELELNPQERLILSENFEKLKAYGIEVEEFGTNSLVVRQIPIELKNSDLNAFIKDLLPDLAKEDNGGENVLEAMRNKIVKTIVCHSSIRVGDNMKRAEMEQLLKELKECQVPYSCPHGRPIIYEIPISELNKRFGR